MFKNTFQSGFLSILYSIGSKPLQLWHIEVDQLGSANRRIWIGFGFLDFILKS